MGLFSGIDTTLELAEALASENGGYTANDNMGYDSEQAVSDAFDEELAPSVIKTYGADDTVAMNETFNNWLDALCKDHEIHSSQYEAYTYIGEHADG